MTDKTITTKTTIIKTECVFPPIPIRALDWEATKDEYEAGEPIGRGSTEKRAIKDFGLVRFVVDL